MHSWTFQNLPVLNAFSFLACLFTYRWISSWWEVICFMTISQTGDVNTPASQCWDNTAWETYPYSSILSVIRLLISTPPSQSLCVYFNILQYCSLVYQIYELFSNTSLLMYLGFHGLITRMKTWTSLSLYLAFMVTTMTQLGWVLSNTCKILIPIYLYLSFHFIICFL